MLPLSLLKSAINHPMLVELKNGETYNGHLANCDAWMNIYLTQVICTSRDGDRFWKMPECYIRGSTIKYLRIPEDVVENFKDDSNNRMNMKGRGDHGSQRGRGGSNQRGGRGNSSQRGNRQGRQGQMSNSTSNSSIGKPFNKQQRK